MLLNLTNRQWSSYMQHFDLFVVDHQSTMPFICQGLCCVAPLDFTEGQDFRDFCVQEGDSTPFWIVESVAEGVTGLQPGDHVLHVFIGECGDCPHCKSEESNMCDLLRINTDRGVMPSDGKSRFSVNRKPIHHFLGTSTFSEYTIVHVGCLAKINPAAPLDKVCVLSCGISTGLGATLNVAKPKKGDTATIFGLGAVGLGAAEGARMAGASRVIGVDLNPSRLRKVCLHACCYIVYNQAELASY